MPKAPADGVQLMDSDDLLTGKWFLAVGFDYYTPDCCDDGKDPVWESGKRLDDDTLLIIREDEVLLEIGDSYWPCEEVKTRGDVRMLCAVLGVEIKEET